MAGYNYNWGPETGGSSPEEAPLFLCASVTFAMDRFDRHGSTRTDSDAGEDFAKSLCSTLADIMKAEFTIPDLILKNFSAKDTGPDTRLSKQPFASEVKYDKDQLAMRYKQQLTLHTTLQQTENELMKAL